MRLRGIENFRKTRKNRIMINGRGDLRIDSDENRCTISRISRTCSTADTQMNSTINASKMHHRLLKYAFSPLTNPLIEIFAIISAKNRTPTDTSHMNVRYFIIGYRSKVFGVLRQTERRDRSAQRRIRRCTQSYNVIFWED